MPPARPEQLGRGSGKQGIDRFPRFSDTGSCDEDSTTKHDGARSALTVAAVLGPPVGLCPASG
ncbi:hypothetical protein ACT16_20810 [Mycobacterium heckeshornense]|nr:hypothetical protein ACT16_20810 [Mycobacterium heckeshornense]